MPFFVFLMPIENNHILFFCFFFPTPPQSAEENGHRDDFCGVGVWCRRPGGGPRGGALSAKVALTNQSGDGKFLMLLFQ